MAFFLQNFLVTRTGFRVLILGKGLQDSAWNASLAKERETCEVVMTEAPLLPEAPISLGQACKILPKNANGKSVNPSTLWRWHRYGLGGVKLQVWKVGGRAYTSREALQRFIAARSVIVPASASVVVVRSNEDVERRLDAIGITARFGRESAA
jgi:hypothetical protein